MSRTYRCKNYEIESRQNSWDRWGKKTALEYTTRSDEGSYLTDEWREYVCPLTDKVKRYQKRAWYLQYPEEMTGRDRWKRWRTMHGESRTSTTRSPNKWHRQIRQRQNRMINKRELNRWYQYDGEYDPCFEANPRDCWWDWM